MNISMVANNTSAESFTCAVIAITLSNPTAAIAGGSNFSTVAALLKYSVNATSVIRVRQYRFSVSSGRKELPSSCIKFSGSRAIIMKKPDSKPIIKVNNCPGKASAFFNNSSLAPERFILSEANRSMAQVITKVIAQIACWPYVHDNAIVATPHTVMRVRGRPRCFSNKTIIA